MKPSSLYRSEFWRIGLLAARLVPRGALERMAVGVTLAYYARKEARREVVIENLLPALEFNRTAAEKKCWNLFRQFGLKLADLWRYEAGCAMTEPQVAPGDWERLEAARANGRGLLLVTPHLGNWEFGAPFLRQRGISLQVITQAEPQNSLTAARKAARARWGIETLVIGENPFAFVDVIRQLQAGRAVALLVDRPPAPSAVEIELFGQPFAASIAAAELARVSGCALLPTCLPRLRGGGYGITLLPELSYERRELGSREGRRNLTQELMRQFEPVIREHLDQWFHFVPLWRKTGQNEGNLPPKRSGAALRSAGREPSLATSPGNPSGFSNGP